MATAVRLLIEEGVDPDPDTELVIPGVVLAGFALPPRELQHKTTKFWGLEGESRINGRVGGRTLRVPVIVYDDYSSAASLASFIAGMTSYQGELGTLTITSDSDYPDFADCVFEGFFLAGEGIKPDLAGTLGGGYFCLGEAIFRQL
jgi:hypothetical protein